MDFAVYQLLFEASGQANRETETTAENPIDENDSSSAWTQASPCRIVSENLCHFSKIGHFSAGFGAITLKFAGARFR